jgi:hypothetical protein
MSAPVDVEVSNHGSIWLVTPITPEAKEWIAEHVSDEAQWLGFSLAVEHRFVTALLEGIADYGFEVLVH